ncbi:MAG TPA: FKBP-type peptidyl-prolyl cis-trans isomerase [Flavobacteriales bacterium]|nr:FKBP-type peptidyl-prolyl cis-trans isomerase [Flavobacteriales bacterium]
MRKFFLLSVCPLAIALLFAQCNKAERQLKKDKKIIEQYIKDHGLTAQSTEDGLYYVIENAGTGTQPSSSSTVKVAYKGYYTDGRAFDASHVSGVDFSLATVIKGWQIGIPKFKEGGKGILLIPSGLGYGPKGRGDIPGNEVLIFDITLIDVL